MSADLDSRGPELDNFQQKAVELQNRKEADGIVKEKKAAVIESVEELTDEWSQIIDRIDAQFKRFVDKKDRKTTGRIMIIKQLECFVFL